jgi:hypothetical protein
LKILKILEINNSCSFKLHTFLSSCVGVLCHPAASYPGHESPLCLAHPPVPTSYMLVT